MRWPVSHLAKLSELLWPPRTPRPTVLPARIHYHCAEHEREGDVSDTRAS